MPPHGPMLMGSPGGFAASYWTKSSAEPVMGCSSFAKQAKALMLDLPPSLAQHCLGFMQQH